MGVPISGNTVPISTLSPGAVYTSADNATQVGIVLQGTGQSPGDVAACNPETGEVINAPGGTLVIPRPNSVLEVS